MALQIMAQFGEAPIEVEGRLRLEAETPWLIRGEGIADLPLLEELQRRLPARCVERIADVLRVHFTNEVGIYKLPSLPVLEIVSGKWDDADYENMLSAISARVAGLPFAAGTGAQLPYDWSRSADSRVLYHAYIYLRHILSSVAPHEERLAPVLSEIIRHPHRRFERYRESKPLHQAQRADARTVRGILRGRMTRGPEALARMVSDRLGGYLPRTIDEPAVKSTVDVPENRFIKAFLRQVVGVIDAVMAEAKNVGGAFEARVEAECAQMFHTLAPIRHAGMWREVGAMTRLPIESMVLQHRQGYRDVLRHFTRLKMTTRIPFKSRGRDLLEVKNIATLYEMWTFFAVEAAVTRVLGRPATADSATTTPLQKTLGYALEISWAGGTTLFYNLNFSRSKGKVGCSYSVPLRPDITLRLPCGRLHLLDAKFRLQRLGHAGIESKDDDNAAERRGDFKRADVYKMHTYRDALDSATAWVLYPGDRFQFFVDEARARPVTDACEIGPQSQGVGAIPLVPGTSASMLNAVISGLMESLKERASVGALGSTR